MADRDLAQRLMREDPNLVWEEIVERAKTRGLEGDDVFRHIIESAQRSRTSVNESLGVGPRGR